MRRFISLLSLTALVIVPAAGLVDPVAGLVDPAAGLVDPAAGLVDPAAGVPEALLQERPVNIRVTCTDGEVDDVNIQPWTARVSRGAGQQLRWRLVGNGISSATIRRKSTSQWPFGSDPPLPVTGGAGTSSGPITAGDGTYFYNIVVDCGNGETVIDPRMDIRP